MALTRSKTAAFQLPGIHFSLGLSTVLLILNTKCILHSLLIFTADKQQHSNMQHFSTSNYLRNENF